MRRNRQEGQSWECVVPEAKERESVKEAARIHCVKCHWWLRQEQDLELAFGFSHVEVIDDLDKNPFPRSKGQASLV